MAIEYCWTNDGERFTGRHPSREDAIEEAKSCTADDRHGQIETAIVIPRDAFGFFPTASDLVEHASNAAYDQCGECVDGWPEMSEEAEADLNLVLSGFLKSWITRHNLEPTFYSVGETQMISTITIDETEGTNDHGE